MPSFVSEEVNASKKRKSQSPQTCDSIFLRGQPSTSLIRQDYFRSINSTTKDRRPEALTLSLSLPGSRSFRGEKEEAAMVFYFKARPEAGDYSIFMGLDKYENEELIKYGFPEDIW